jgi:molybdate transport system permease protein
MGLTPGEWDAVRLSLKVAVCCVAVSLGPAVLLGWLLARCRFRGQLLVDGLCHLPLVLPPVVTGYLLLRVFSPTAPVGRLLEQGLGLRLAFDWKGAVVASAVVGFPLMLRAVRLAIEAIDTRLEQVARTLGSGPIRVFLRVTLPLALPGVVVGSVLSFARSLGEFGATITFAANIAGQTRTLPAAVFTYLSQPGGEAAVTRLAFLSVALSLVALLLSEWLARRARSG